ncbi:MAG: cupredoxin domain-containing protein [Acidimicrobiales bacterium]
MRNRLLLVAAGACGGALLTACTPPNLPPATRQLHNPGSKPPTADVGATVSIVHGIFAPLVVSIHAGQAVEWEWVTPDIPADIVSSTFHSPVLDHGHYVHTFSQPGVYTYRSTLSSISHGKVVVSS